MGPLTVPIRCLGKGVEVDKVRGVRLVSFRTRENPDARGLRSCQALRQLDAIRASKGGAIMSLYLYQAAYTSESIAAQIKEPRDRIEAVRPAVEAMGATIVAGGYPFGDYDVLIVMEAPDDTTAATVALAVAAGGAVRSAKTTRLLSGAEWIEALTKAQSSRYQPAR